jgi:hypothetical protein
MRRIGIVVAALSMLVGAGVVVGARPAQAALTTCNGPTPLTGNQGALNVPPGGDCLVHDATVNGNVSVQNGGRLHMDFVTVYGSVYGQNPQFIELGRDFSGGSGPGPVRITGSLTDVGDATGAVFCQTTVSGNVAVSGGGPPWIGDPELDEITSLPCVGNNFNGSLSVANTGGTDNFVVEHNTVNSTVTVSGNNAPNVVIDGNHIGGSLGCSGNTPAPNNLESGPPDPNTVAGRKSGQCAGL